mmetsp:Transcript_86595/g.245134  ORF Transcript_86595/g.245134 Transcript_86595/m.245134 type:complete len:251 (-) Transcript_86595:326-1078(-)
MVGGHMGPVALDVLLCYLIAPLLQRRDARLRQQLVADLVVLLQEYQAARLDGLRIVDVAHVEHLGHVGYGRREAGSDDCGHEALACHLPGPLRVGGLFAGLVQLGRGAELVLHPALQPANEGAAAGAELIEGEAADVLVSPQQHVHVAAPGYLGGRLAEGREAHLQGAVCVEVLPPAAQEAATSLLCQDVYQLLLVLQAARPFLVALPVAHGRHAHGALPDEALVALPVILWGCDRRPGRGLRERGPPGI